MTAGPPSLLSTCAVLILTVELVAWSHQINWRARICNMIDFLRLIYAYIQLTLD